MRSLKITPTITDRSSLSLQMYFKDINQFKPLTPEEEYEVALKAFEGDRKSQDKLVKHNLRFVISIAKQYTRFGLKLEDLINEGNVGLVKASTNFDPSRGFKFVTYAVWSIRQTMQVYIQKNGKTIRPPLGKFIKSFKMKKAYTLLEQKLERKPSHDELVENLKGGYSENDVKFFLESFSVKIQSLDAPLSDNSDSGTLMDVLKNTNSNQTNELVNLNDSDIRTDILLEKLDDSEKTILILLFGLDGREPISIKELSNKCELTNARITLIRDKALRKLKYKLINGGNWLKNV